MKPVICTRLPSDRLGQELETLLPSIETVRGTHTVTSNYTLQPTDTIDSLRVDATAAALTITLPPPSGSRRRRIIKIDSSTNVVTIATGTAATISGTTTYNLYNQFRFIEVEPTGTDWIIISTGTIFTTALGSNLLGRNSLATTATDGFAYIPSCAGPPTGVPIAFTGRIPLVIDSTNNKLYFYSGGAWRDAGP